MTATTKTSLQQHPLSAAFPAMLDVDLEALADDIKKNGQREPGVLYEGMVLDGWHRYLACEQAGKRFMCGDFVGTDPVSFVLSKNLHRRHLTGSQRAAAIVAATSWRSPGRPAGKAEATSGLSEKAMAKAAEVSDRTIRDAKVAHDAGLGDLVKEGKVSATQAAAVAKLPAAQREKAREAIERGEKPATPKKPKVVAAERKFEKLYEAVKAELVETKEALAEMTEMAASAEAFKNKVEFKEMQNLRAELRAVKQRRGELMRENAEIRKDLAYWKNQAKKK